MTNKVARISKGDTLRALAAVIKTSQKQAIDVSPYTVKFTMVDDADAVVVAETTTGVTVHPTFAVTFDSALVQANAHSVAINDQVVFATTGTLPSTITAGTRYYVVSVEPNAFKVAASPIGEEIEFSGGSGAHTAYVVGMVQYAWQSGDVDTAGDFWCWFRCYSGSSVFTAPSGSGIALIISERESA